MSTVESRRSTRSATSPAKKNWLSEVTRAVKQRPSASIVYGVPGVGKTSFAAYMPGVVFMTDAQEQGIHELKASGLVPSDIPVLPPVQSWADGLDMLESLRVDEHDYKRLAIDALGGFERLGHEHVCKTLFSDDWGKNGFTSYQQGYDASLSEFRHFINACDRLRDERQMSIVILGHAKITPFKNPEGPDYDRYNVDVHHKTWSLFHKWADMVLFANYEVAFNKGESEKSKAKAKGGKVRLLHAEHSVAFDAKNRHNLPADIVMGDSGKEAWDNLVNAIKDSRKAGN